jgi:hypothetical protein
MPNKRIAGLLVLCGGLALCAAQETKPALAPTVASVLEKQLSLVEKEGVSAAEAMPEEKYSFAPSDGEFKGARTFAQQVRHIGSATNMLFGAFYGEKADFELAEKGPANVTTKAQIVEYVKAAFAKGHRAIATLTPEDACLRPLRANGSLPAHEWNCAARQPRQIVHSPGDLRDWAKRLDLGYSLQP